MFPKEWLLYGIKVTRCSEKEPSLTLALQLSHRTYNTCSVQSWVLKRFMMNLKLYVCVCFQSVNHMQITYRLESTLGCFKLFPKFLSTLYPIIYNIFPAKLPKHVNLFFSLSFNPQMHMKHLLELMISHTSLKGENSKREWIDFLVWRVLRINV